MTGEVSLTGRVLPIGGVKQKLLAAHRAGITEVILPARNEPDLDDVPAAVREVLTVHLVSDVRDVLALALEPAASTALAALSRRAPGPLPGRGPSDQPPAVRRRRPAASGSRSPPARAPTAPVSDTGVLPVLQQVDQPVRGVAVGQRQRHGARLGAQVVHGDQSCRRPRRTVARAPSACGWSRISNSPQPSSGRLAVAADQQLDEA